MKLKKQEYVSGTPQSVIKTYDKVMSKHANVKVLRMRNAEADKQLLSLRAIGDGDRETYYRIALGLSCLILNTARHSREGKTFIPNKKVAIVFIDRAARVMAEAARQLFPEITTFCVDMKRDHDTGIARLIRNDIPPEIARFEIVYLVDPMLATGGTASDTVELFADMPNKATFPEGGNWVPIENISFAGVVGCPEGIRHLQRNHAIPITLAGIDMRLNDVFYILAHPEEALSAQAQTVYKQFQDFDLATIYDRSSIKEREHLIMLGDFGDNYLGLRRETAA